MFLLLRLVKPLLLIAVLVVAYLYLPVIGSVSGQSLHTSVVNEVGGTTEVGPKSCTKRGSVTWRCDVWAGGSSGPESYTVRRQGRRCWTARKRQAQVEDVRLAKRASGCVRLRDQGSIGRTLADFI